MTSLDPKANTLLSELEASLDKEDFALQSGVGPKSEEQDDLRGSTIPWEKIQVRLFQCLLFVSGTLPRRMLYCASLPWNHIASAVLLSRRREGSNRRSLPVAKKQQSQAFS